MPYTNEIYENLGKKVRELRIQNGLTQEQVADALEVTPGYISNVENNRSAMTLRVLMYYADLTNISLDSLVGDIEPSYQATALDHEILKLLSAMSVSDKEKLLSTLKIWF